MIYQDIYNYLKTSGPFQIEGYEPGESTIQTLHETKILVIGAGGLGCELLKNLALSGFLEIHVIDMDTIDISNLNRQFLFRQSDVGKPKAVVAAEFIMKRIPNVNVIPYFGKIQDKDEDYYRQFTLIICGLDSIEARRWINATIVGMCDSQDYSGLIPIIDGGTEGFKGQSRVILPRISACFECSMDMQTKQTKFPICTIANTPRLPEHCIEWASVLEWPNVFKDVKLDGDNPEHVTWLFKTAKRRAEEFQITGVTYSLTQGVVKNIIPAIASTNAIIAASCTNEAFKIVTNCARYLDNYMMYTGDSGVYTYTFQLQKNETCPVCGSVEIPITRKSESTLQEFIDFLLESKEYQLKRPTLFTPNKSLYMRSGALHESTKKNLDLELKILISSGERVTVLDDSFPVPMNFIITLD